MSSVRSALWGRFQALTSQNVETVRSKLAEVASQIASAEHELDRVALGAALNDDPAAGFDAVARLSELKIRQDLLQRALAAAEAAEQARLTEAKIKANRAQFRAFGQHLVALNKAGEEMQAAVEREEQAWRKMIKAAGAARSLVPPIGRDDYNPLFEISLDRLVSLERARIGRRDPMTSRDPSLPASQFGGALEYWRRAPLAHVLAAELDTLRRQFAQSLDLPSPSPAPSNVTLRPVAASSATEPEPQAARPEPLAALAAPAPNDGDGANPSAERERNPHPPGEAHEEFEAALAEMKGAKIVVPDLIGRWNG